MHAEDGFFCVFQPFCHTVRRDLCDCQALSDCSATLMMGAVDCAYRSVEAVQEGTGEALDQMMLILVLVSVNGAGGKVLNDSSAKIHVDDLNTPADSEDRFVSFYEGIKEGELNLVKMGVYGLGAAVALAEPGRVDIASAGQEQSAVDGQVRGMERSIPGDSAGRKGCFVVLSEV